MEQTAAGGISEHFLLAFQGQSYVDKQYFPFDKTIALQTRSLPLTTFGCFSSGFGSARERKAFAPSPKLRLASLRKPRRGLTVCLQTCSEMTQKVFSHDTTHFSAPSSGRRGGDRRSRGGACVWERRFRFLGIVLHRRALSPLSLRAFPSPGEG